MQNLILLHGALGSKEQFNDLETHLTKDFFTYSFNFYGHGGLAIPDSPFAITDFSNQLLAFIADKKIERANIFGYSMGGYVALHAALHHPERFNKIITLATKFHWDPVVSEKENNMLNAEKIETKIPAFAKQLAEWHAPVDWKQLISKIKELLTYLGNKSELTPADFEQIKTSCLILLGDNDKMVSREETMDVAKKIPQSALGILPHTAHPFETVDSSLLALLIKQFIAR